MPFRRGWSLHRRLTFAGTVAILIALLVAAGGLAILFDRHVARVAVADLHSRVLAIAAKVETGDDERPVLLPVAIDPLYDRVFSGHYWQVELDGVRIRSRSLWDTHLDWPDAPTRPGEWRQIDLTGPEGEALLGLETLLTVGSAGVALRVVTATDREELVAARRGFMLDLVPFLGVLGILLVIGSWLQVRTGLGPLNDVSARVAALRGVPNARVGTDLPTEILPLAQEIDLLLDERDADLARARHRAADLAHGFKTPLQALFGDAAELRAKGETDVAESVETIAASMRALVDRELTRARIQSDRRVATADAGKVVRRVVDVLRRTPAGKHVDWELDVGAACLARVDEEDLTEVVGAILENACRFAEQVVSVRVWKDGQQVGLCIRDDGPGVEIADLSRIVGRGVRLDESTEGEGIGLALVSDILDAAGGAFAIRNTVPGLEVTVGLRPA